jgi:hypothetical protein
MNWGWEAISTALGGLWFLMRICFRVGEGVKEFKLFRTNIVDRVKDHETRIVHTEQTGKRHGKTLRKHRTELDELRGDLPVAPLPA